MEQVKQQTQTLSTARIKQAQDLIQRVRATQNTIKMDKGWLERQTGRADTDGPKMTMSPKGAPSRADGIPMYAKGGYMSMDPAQDQEAKQVAQQIMEMEKKGISNSNAIKQVKVSAGEDLVSLEDSEKSYMALQRDIDTRLDTTFTRCTSSFAVHQKVDVAHKLELERQKVIENPESPLVQRELAKEEYLHRAPEHIYHSTQDVDIVTYKTEVLHNLQENILQQQRQLEQNQVLQAYLIQSNIELQHSLQHQQLILNNLQASNNIVRSLEIQRQADNFKDLVLKVNPHNPSKDLLIAATTQKVYERIYNRQKDITIDDLPHYIEQRQMELSKGAFYKEQAVAKRITAALQRNAQTQEQQQFLQAVQTKLVDFSFAGRQQQYNPAKDNHENQTVMAYQKLKQTAVQKEDWDLHDTLVVSRVTGCRPAEIQKGVQLYNKDDGTTDIHIQGAKKSNGNPDAQDAAQRVQKGMDRVVNVKNDDIQAIAQRRDGYFKPENIDTLQQKISRWKQSAMTEKEQLQAQNFSLYSLRNLYASEQRQQMQMEKQQINKEQLAKNMGHQSVNSQQSYGTYQEREGVSITPD